MDTPSGRPALEAGRLEDPQPGRQAGQTHLASSPGALQILSAEHFSLLSARGLAYNEVFTRAGLFLTFVSMSFVALALVAQAMQFDREFLVVVAVVLVFDLVIGITSYIRVAAAGGEDLRAVHGMNRIRHGYIELAPEVAPYFTAPTSDDAASVLSAYGVVGPQTPARDLASGLSSSFGLVGLVVAMLAGVLGGVVGLGLGASDWLALVMAAVTTVVAVVLGAWWGITEAAHIRSSLVAAFPGALGEGDPTADQSTKHALPPAASA